MDIGLQPLSVKNQESNPPAKEYEQLRQEYVARTKLEGAPSEARLVAFAGIPDGKDAYNPSGPFIYDGNVYQWVRIESREAQDAVAMLFKQNADGTYERVEGVASLPIEDPFTTTVNGEVVVGGVEISKDTHGRVINYRTVFYRGASFAELAPAHAGPDEMKDIRFIAMPEQLRTVASQFFVFTRPHIPKHGALKGRIAFTIIASLDELTPMRLRVESTEILPNMFADAEWGGVNDVYDLGNGFIGALCHISKFDGEGKRHYAPAAFVMKVNAGEFTPLEMLTERGDFPAGPVKIMPENLDRPEMQDDLADVVFSSRLSAADFSADVLTPDTLMLTCGLSDAAVGMVTIPNPFKRLLKQYFPQA